MNYFLGFYGKEFQPGERLSIAVVGDHIRGVAGSYPYEIELGASSPSKFETGIAYGTRGDLFESVVITNTADVAQYIEVAVAVGEIKDNRLVGQVDISGGIRSAANRAAEYGAITVGTTPKLIKVSNSNRGKLLLQNLGSNALYIGTDNTVTTSTGLKIGPGGSGELTFVSDVYGVADVGTVDTRYIEESL